MPYLKPLPTPTIANAEFWDGLKRHEFLVPKCDGCGDYNWVPYPACRSCQCEAQSWTKVSGDATLWTFTVVHRGPGAFGDAVPYIVAIAKLAEQPRSLLVLANMVSDVAPDDVRIGMPVRIVYEDIPGEDFTMYKFAPADAG
jgi:uncharacterized OB-fold protein